MQVTELLHVNVEVTDVERALAFYRLFGLEEIQRQGTPGRAGAWLRFPDGCELHLSLGSAYGPEPSADRSAKVPSRQHFAIRVKDLAAARRVIEQAGAPIESEREIAGLIRFFTRDPDGNRIEIVETSGATSNVKRQM